MASLGPKKDGGPNADFFQSPESLQGFEAVRQWLQRNCKKVRTTAAAILLRTIYTTNTILGERKKYGVYAMLTLCCIIFFRVLWDLLNRMLFNKCIFFKLFIQMLYEAVIQSMLLLLLLHVFFCLSIYTPNSTDLFIFLRFCSFFSTWLK